GRYVDVNIQRDAAARFGMNIADVQSVIASAVGGENIGETAEGLQRFPINVRYPRELRSVPAASLAFAAAMDLAPMPHEAGGDRREDEAPARPVHVARVPDADYFDPGGRRVRLPMRILYCRWLD
ncbi:efflux RND transporter permease subunit, partial [Variovorax sp. RT4R15]|uniref:efflux RND transporter permease subunit n=1 Tax=Variovorax sp. RT4R15 TaxID=3443737 RepID=UPI003F457EC9